MSFCKLCANRDAYIRESLEKGLIFVQCDNCGKYIFKEDYFEDFDTVKKGEELWKHLISGYVREMNDLGKDDLLIEDKEIDNILKSPLLPSTPNDKLNKVLLHIYRNTLKIGFKIENSYDNTRATGYAIDTEEAIEMYNILDELGYIELNNTLSHCISKLTIRGFNYVEKLTKEISKSNTAFVAMWFSDEVEVVYKTAILPAIETGNYFEEFKAFRVDKEEHNNDINDEIIANIKQAKFIVADFTGNRAGVYYEAGFARGLGIPVIHTCRKDWFNGKMEENKKVHFDLEHMNFIVWETEEELKEKLINRIKATII